MPTSASNAPRADRTNPAPNGEARTQRIPVNDFYGDLIASAVMIAAGVVEWLFGVHAERKSLEDVAKPLTAAEAEAETTA